MSESDDTSLRTKYEQRIRDYLATARHYDQSAAECHADGTVRDPAAALTDTEQDLALGMKHLVDMEEPWYATHQAVALEYRDHVDYVEGFVASAGVVVPIQHAWVEFTDTGHLVDLTLPAPLADDRTVAYVGKTFDTPYIADLLFDRNPESQPLLGNHPEWH